MSTKTEVENIYDKYIIPLIKKCEADDELLFISPSTFFGFYSLGVRNFESVCCVLEEAVGRKANVKLIVFMRNQMSANAARGLLDILDYDQSIRQCSNSNYYQFYLIYNHVKALKGYRIFVRMT